ncbi:MAG: hypothetical protein LBT80_05245 [Lactobacillaceae bacterium]|jgi:hypothetical protein|nr:hypothetical protein [Lactobacillaceae bacterium]
MMDAMQLAAQYVFKDSWIDSIAENGPDTTFHLGFLAGQQSSYQAGNPEVVLADLVVKKALLINAKVNLNGNAIVDVVANETDKLVMVIHNDGSGAATEITVHGEDFSLVGHGDYYL